MTSLRSLTEQARSKDSLLFLITFFITLATLMSEILSIRAAKLAFGVSFEFFIIPLVVLGMGLGGILVSILKKESGAMRSGFFLPALAYPLVAASPFILAHYEAGTGPAFLPETAFFLCGLLSYCLAGWIVSSILGYKSASVSTLYCFDLAGAACGVILTVAISNTFGYEAAVAVFCICSLLSTLLTIWYFYPGKKISSGLVFLIVVIVAPNTALPSLFSISCSGETFNVRSNAYTQVEMRSLSPTLGAQRLGIPAGTLPASVSVYEIGIDCFTSGTARLKFSVLSDADFLKSGLRSIPLAFLQESGQSLNSALVLGSGGGLDVTRARVYRVASIDAVELNPLVVDAARSFPSDPSDPYASGDVRVHVTDSRQFVSSTHDTYQLILDIKSTRYGSSPFSADTNYASTEEAESLYLEHLAPGGLLVQTTNSGSLDAAVKKAIDALQGLGISAADRIVYIKGYEGVEDLLLIRTEPFSENDIALLAETSHMRGFGGPLLFDNDMAGSALLHANSSVFSDDRPFVWDFATQFGEATSPAEILQNLTVGAGVVFILLLGTMFLPFFKARARKDTLLSLACYFASIGFGLIAFEIAVIQKFSLVVANPGDSIAVALSSVLFFGGLGSLATMRIPTSKVRAAITFSTACLIVWVATLLFLGSALSEHMLPLSLLYRVVFALVALAIPGFILGIFFPIGIMVLRRLEPGLVPWAWGTSGIAGVLGGFAAKIVSFEYGISKTLILIAFSYALAWICSRKMAQHL
jgi:hypothetical protein